MAQGDVIWKVNTQTNATYDTAAQACMTAVLADIAAHSELGRKAEIFPMTSLFNVTADNFSVSITYTYISS